MVTPWKLTVERHSQAARFNPAAFHPVVRWLSGFGVIAELGPRFDSTGDR